MLIPFTEAESNRPVFINPKHVVAVFIAHDGQFTGNTVINLANGNLVTKVDQLETVGIINGALQNSN